VINKISADLYDCRLYVALFPCNECAKVIIQAGIAEVIYLSDKYAKTDAVKASRRMFEAAGVRCRQLEVSRSQVTILFAEQGCSSTADCKTGGNK
jgi:dCMP deaminase